MIPICTMNTVSFCAVFASFVRIWNENPATAVRIPGHATIPLGSNLGQVVYIHCLPSFSAPRNWGTNGSFFRCLSAIKWLW